MATPQGDVIPLTGNNFIDGLVQGSAWTWQPGANRTLTYSFHMDPPAPYLPWLWTSESTSAMRGALATWSAVANLQFVQVSDPPALYQSNADLALSISWVPQDPSLVALAFFPDPAFVDQVLAEIGWSRAQYPKPEGDVFINYASGVMDYLQRGELGYWVLIHELGHALGLKQPFDDGGNGRPTFTELGIGSYDDGHWTVMSYDDTNPYSLYYGHAMTPMPLDILAIQQIYGPNMSYHRGNDVYRLVNDQVWTIWDAGGVDTIDASGLASPINLSLEGGTVNYFGFPGAIGIAFNVAIENAIGSPYSDTLVGNAADNSLVGGGGDDTITGGDGNDILDGGLGQDTVDGGAGNDQITMLVTAGNVDIIDAGDGTDTLLLSGVVPGNHEVVVDLSSTTDQITSIGGPPNSESLAQVDFENLNAAGIGSFVTVTGSDGDNVIIGSKGNDTLTGGAGYDQLIGGLGADSLIGGLGDDTYGIDNLGDTLAENLNEGTDLVQSSITHTLGANFENLTLTGVGAINGTGNDMANVLTGNSATNVLLGGDGTDTLIGNAGNDTLTGGTGDDVMDGGAGNDVFLIGAATDHGAGEIITGGAGADVIRFTSTTGGETLSLGAGITQIESVAIANAAGLTTGTTVVNVDASAMGSGLTITGNAGANVLTGTGFDDVLNGGAGGDTLDGRAGKNLLIGGSGNDTFFVNAATDLVSEALNGGTDAVQTSLTYTLGANVENLTLIGISVINGTGNTLNNILIGNSAANILTGGAGNDNLNGGAGADTLVGGAGNDTYTVDNVGDVVTEALNAGTDTVLSAVSYQLSNNVENLTLTSNLAIDGTGNALNNILTGNSDINVLTGGKGNDTYVVQNDTDSMVEDPNAGIDLVQSVAANFTLGANVENLTLMGTGNVNGVGNGLNNILTGNSGNNLLDGKAGADKMAGGAGNDTYVVENLADIVTETLAGAAGGTDTVVAALNYTLGANLENLSLTGLTGLENLNGTGNPLNNVLTGNSGNNVLVGLVGNDTLEGGAGNDTLDGGVGADDLQGGMGDDTYVIDNLGDSVTENPGEGTDTVKITYSNSAATVATLSLSPGLVPLAPTGAQGLAGAVLGARAVGVPLLTIAAAAPDKSFEQVENLTVTGVGLFNLVGSEADNVLTGNSTSNVLWGLGGNDTLVGRAGNDTLLGGEDNDILNGGVGRDTVQGGAGEDLVLLASTAELAAGETMDGGDGTDTIRYTGAAATTLTLTNFVTDIEQVEIATAAGDASGRAAINVNAAAVTSNGMTLVGNNGVNVLTGTGQADTLIGNAGNDTLRGGLGNDTYQVNRGDGQDKISDVDGTPGNSDKLLYGATINPLDLVLSRQVNDLRIAVHGSSDRVTIQNWYTSQTVNQIETIQAGNGQTLLSTQVDQLIQAMAAFSAQNGGITWDQAIDQNPQGVQAVLAANGWQ